MKLYNTLTRQTEDIQPLEGQTVRLYSCGPTVYDHIHIGNLSSFIFADTVRRALKLAGIDVQHVMNFTDIDDKTIKRSSERYPDLPALDGLLKLTSEYGDVFLKDMAAVGNEVAAFTFVKATDSIENMQELIRELHRASFAYIADDGVYFSIEAYTQSGKKYGQLTEITASSTSEARIQNDEYDKESAHDFALWKAEKPGEPAWDFTLGETNLRGRPGWHIECSAMSKALLGQPFDIHTGGVDLIFPHHENEIAQSTAGQTDSLLAKSFVHNEHLLVDGQKMSKSLNNFYTLKDITDKGFDPLAFRLLVLQAHYRTQAHFSWANLEAAQNRLRRIKNMAELRHQLAPQTEYAQSTSIERSIADIQDNLANDLDTPAVLATIESELDEFEHRGIMSESRESFDKWLKLVDNALGLNLTAATPDISEEHKHFIAARLAARQDQDWSKSDQLRDQLVKQGIGLRDTPHGAIWFRL